MPKKILRITIEVNRGSIGRTAEQLGELCIKEKWESYIAYGRSDGESKSTKIRIGNKFGVYMHGIFTRLFDIHGKCSYFATKRFVSKIKKISPDLIHLHAIHGYYLNYSVLFKYLKEANIPVVWTQHDCWAYTGHCAHYTEISCYKWQDQCHNCPLKGTYPASLRDRSRKNFIEKIKAFTSVKNMHIVAVSKWMKNELESSFLNKYPIHLIYNGIDCDRYKPQQDNETATREKYNLGSKKILLGVAASWTRNKGIDDYIQLSGLLPNEYQIVMVGVTPELQKRLPKEIICINRTDNINELVNLYSASLVVLNLSREETFGKTTAEALACGVPGIVYNSTASPELISKSTGVVCEKGDINSVLDAIKMIAVWNREETIINCRERALKHFESKKNYKKYIALYKSIIGA